MAGRAQSPAQRINITKKDGRKRKHFSFGEDGESSKLYIHTAKGKLRGKEREDEGRNRIGEGNVTKNLRSYGRKGDDALSEPAGNQ